MNVLSLIIILTILVFIYIKINTRGFEFQGRLMKVISKISLSKNNHILIIQVMEKYYLCASNQEGVQILESLDEARVLEYMDMYKATLFKKR